jgi:hypothetical protein
MPKNSKQRLLEVFSRVVPDFKLDENTHDFKDYEGIMWHVDTGYSHDRNTTAGDVVRFERDEYSNNYGITDEQLKELDKYSARQISWYTINKKDALHYGRNPEKHNVNGKIIAEDGDGGYLVLEGEPRLNNKTKTINEAPYQQFDYSDAIRVEKKMIEEFGETYNPNVCGFITIGGHMIDFSGGDLNIRGMDHREVGYIFNDLDIDLGKYNGNDWKYSNSWGLCAIMDMGIIRFIPEWWGFDMHVMPTQEQFEKLREILPIKNGRCYIDLTDGSNKANIEHESETPVDFIIDGIKDFYRYGDKPKSYNDYEEDDNLNEDHSIKDFKYNKVKNVVQSYLDKSKIKLEDINPNNYFILAFDVGNHLISFSVSPTKEASNETIKYLKSKKEVYQVIIEKPTIGVQSFMKDVNYQWTTQSNVYGDQNQLKLDLSEDVKQIQTLKDLGSNWDVDESIIETKRTIIF